MSPQTVKIWSLGLKVHCTLYWYQQNTFQEDACCRACSCSSTPPVVTPFVPGSSSSASIDPYVVLSTQFLEHSLKITTQLEKMSTRQEDIQQGSQNDLMYICSFIRHLQTCVDESYGRYAWPVLLSSSYAQPLPSTDPPFDLWVPPPAPSEAPASPEDPNFLEDWTPFVMLTKRGRVIGII